jgi:hypothetical protein
MTGGPKTREAGMFARVYFAGQIVRIANSLPLTSSASGPIVTILMSGQAT